MICPRIAPAGWATRHFTVAQLVDVLTACAPPLVEISKDFIRDDVSLKDLGRAVATIRSFTDAPVAFAGTTDLVACAGLTWPRYRLYTAVQIAQARFLDSTYFRLFVGERTADVSPDEIVARVGEFCADLAPIVGCVEIHGGVECDPEVLTALLDRTAAMVLIDCETLGSKSVTTDELLAIVPLDRVAYFHQRNLPGHWTEHPASLEDETRWHTIAPEGAFLWEPKTIADPRRISELLGEYRTSH